MGGGGEEGRGRSGPRWLFWMCCWVFGSAPGKPGSGAASRWTGVGGGPRASPRHVGDAARWDVLRSPCGPLGPMRSPPAEPLRPLCGPPWPTARRPPGALLPLRPPCAEPMRPPPRAPAPFNLFPIEPWTPLRGREPLPPHPLPEGLSSALPTLSDSREGASVRLFHPPPPVAPAPRPEGAGPRIFYK